MLRIFLFSVVLLTTACTSSIPKITRINGKSVVQTERKVLGIPVWTSEDEVLTHEQKLEDLAIKTEARQSAFAFWLGAACLVSAVACVVIGYVSHGWKFWGGLSALCVGLGTLSFSYEHLVHHLKWVAGAAIVSAVLWTMWKAKDFSLLTYIKKRKEAGRASS